MPFLFEAEVAYLFIKKDKVKDMERIIAISGAVIPTIIMLLILHGVKNKVSVYDCFVEGAKDGLETVVKVCPTLIGLMTGVGVLRASGFLDALTLFVRPAAAFVHFPGELVPVTIVRMFSSSAATGLILDIFKTYGPDSKLGLVASVSNACTETIFYTMSVYFLTARVRKTRWTLAGALAATFAGIIASVCLVNWMLR